MKLKPIIPKSNPLKQIMRAVVAAGADLAAQGVKRDLEGMVKSWQHKPAFTIEKAGDDTRRVVTDDEVFIYQDQGTKAHTIVPRRKRALFWKGAAHPVRVVHHPGTKAMHYTEQAAKRGAGIMLDAMNEVIRKALS